MPADRLAPRGADLREALPVLLDVGHVAGHPHEMLRPGSVLGEDGEDVGERLAELAGEILALEPFLGVPADHPRGDDQPPPGRDAVGIALGARPAGREQILHPPSSRKWLRAITTFCTSEAPS